MMRRYVAVVEMVRRQAQKGLRQGARDNDSSLLTRQIQRQERRIYDVPMEDKCRTECELSGLI